MMQLRNISKSFREQSVLSNLNLQLQAREMISIMGKSGSGKSTLLGIMAGLIKPDSGQVIYDSSPIQDLDEEQLAAFRLNHIGFIFQDFKLIPSLSVYDNILLGIYPRTDIAKAEKERRVREFVGQVGLTQKLDEKTDNLSGGERQRVAIARSLVNHPELILADEPTGNLDAVTAQEIMTLFTELHNKSDTTFVIITHDADITAYTQKHFTLQNGALHQ
jgi:ABC-type lipoprotein export system ATPase subunit